MGRGREQSPLAAMGWQGGHRHTDRARDGMTKHSWRIMPTSIPEVDYPCVVVTKVGVDGSALADGGGWRTLGGVGDGGR
jgi:hypothetical protein